MCFSECECFVAAIIGIHGYNRKYFRRCMSMSHSYYLVIECMIIFHQLLFKANEPVNTPSTSWKRPIYGYECSSCFSWSSEGKIDIEKDRCRIIIPHVIQDVTRKLSFPQLMDDPMFESDCDKCWSAISVKLQTNIEWLYMLHWPTWSMYIKHIAYITKK